MNFIKICIRIKNFYWDKNLKFFRSYKISIEIKIHCKNKKNLFKWRSHVPIYGTKVFTTNNPVPSAP